MSTKKKRRLIDPNEIISVAEAAEILNKPQQTIYSRFNRGTMKGFRIASTVCFLRPEIESLVGVKARELSEYAKMETISVQDAFEYDKVGFFAHLNGKRFFVDDIERDSKNGYFVLSGSQDISLKGETVLYIEDIED